MSTYRAVLFDMDGVIVDSEPRWERVWREEIFPAVAGDPSLGEVTGRDFTETIPELGERYGLTADVDTLLSTVERHGTAIYAEQVDVSPDVLALFDDLRGRGLQVGIVSSAPHEWIGQVVDRFDLAPLAVVVSAGEIDGPGKPDPAVYERAMRDLGVDPETCVVIEDSESGVQAGAAAGATVVRFQQSGTPDPIPGADAVADDLSELRRALSGLLDGDRNGPL